MVKITSGIKYPRFLQLLMKRMQHLPPQSAKHDTCRHCNLPRTLCAARRSGRAGDFPDKVYHNGGEKETEIKKRN